MTTYHVNANQRSTVLQKSAVFFKFYVQHSIGPMLKFPIRKDHFELSFSETEQNTHSIPP